IAVGPGFGTGGTVVLVAVVAFEKTQGNIGAAVELVTDAGIEGFVAVTVLVAVVAGVHDKAVDAIGFEVGAVYAVAQIARAAAAANRHLVQAVAAGGGGDVGVLVGTAGVGAAIAGKDLDHSADSLAAIQAGVSAAYHLDALD